MMTGVWYKNSLFKQHCGLYERLSDLADVMILWSTGLSAGGTCSAPFCLNIRLIYKPNFTLNRICLFSMYVCVVDITGHLSKRLESRLC